VPWIGFERCQLCATASEKQCGSELEDSQCLPLGPAAGRCITLVDARGNRTSFSYDAGGQKTAELDPLGRVTTYAYDPVGVPFPTVPQQRSATGAPAWPPGLTLLIADL